MRETPYTPSRFLCESLGPLVSRARLSRGENESPACETTGSAEISVMLQQAADFNMMAEPHVESSMLITAAAFSTQGPFTGIERNGSGHLFRRRKVCRVV